jgi:flagellar basal body-associated protein FliL
MATYTPPPYFPQGAMSPPDESRYRKFKLIIAVAVVAIVVLLAGLGIGVWYLFHEIIRNK